MATSNAQIQVVLLSCGHWFRDDEDQARHKRRHPFAFPLVRVPVAEAVRRSGT